MRMEIVAGCMVLSLANAAAAVEVGDPAPEIKVRGWVNEEHAGGLAALRGKVVLLEFWSTG